MRITRGPTAFGLPIPSVNNALNPGANYINQGYGQNVGPADRDLDVGNCVQDRRQLANVTFVYLTPRFSNNLTRIVASGWTFASTFVVRSGAFLTPLTSTITGSGHRFRRDYFDPTSQCAADKHGFAYAGPGMFRCNFLRELAEPGSIRGANSGNVRERGRRQHSRPRILAVGPGDFTGIPDS